MLGEGEGVAEWMRRYVLAMEVINIDQIIRSCESRLNKIQTSYPTEH